MIRVFKKFKKNQKGFTLIEILIVILIIGILFLALLPRIDSASDKGRQTGVKSDFRTFQIAVESYFRETAGNGLTFDGLHTYLDAANRFTTTKGGTTDATGAIQNGTTYYTKLKDPWGAPYEVQFKDLTGTTAQFIMKSVGKKGGSFASGADFVLAVYYKDGVIDSCTTGFDSGNVQLKSFGIACGADI